MSARPFEVEVFETGDTPFAKSAYSWRVQAEGETIALGLGCSKATPLEAFHAAKAWARMHEQQGFAFRKDYWL